uniref:Uncharacterized protein n=1 Tax=Hyaloperonospora arabidopsidis (strain Emoy2) TaxID=559515 RepID=M4BZE9_HYAAE
MVPDAGMPFSVVAKPARSKRHHGSEDCNNQCSPRLYNRSKERTNGCQPSIFIVSSTNLIGRLIDF